LIVIENRMIHVHRGRQLPDGLTSPDTYFLPGYGWASGIADDGEWVLLEAYDGAWQVPLILRTLADGAKDAISPYGYTGIYASPTLSLTQVKEAWSSSVNCLRDLGVLDVLVRHSPLVPQAYDLPGLVPIVREHPTIVLEPVDSDSAWSAMESRCRNQTRKAMKNGYTGDVKQATGQDLAPGSDFRRLYEETMRRLSATSRYFFGDDYYKELLAGLGSNLLMAEVRNSAGVTVSSTLLMRHAQRLHYHLTGSNVDDARMGTNNLMLWTATQYAVAQGINQFHLGGGLEARDDLFRFKRKFGGRELEYRVSGLIIDEDLYRTRTENRARVCDLTPDALLASGYFPAYRGGTPGSQEAQPPDTAEVTRDPHLAASSILPTGSACQDDEIPPEHTSFEIVVDASR
jgi:serine/alanine adding enzyme